MEIYEAAVRALKAAVERQHEELLERHVLLQDAKDEVAQLRDSLKTVAVDTVLLWWHADKHAEPECKRCHEWYQVLLQEASSKEATYEWVE